jgi:hypothetical protein
MPSSDPIIFNESDWKGKNRIDWTVMVGDRVTVIVKGVSHTGVIDKLYTLGDFRMVLDSGTKVTFHPMKVEVITKECEECEE